MEKLKGIVTARRVILIALIVLEVLLLTVWVFSFINTGLTGFEGVTEWEWIQLLVIPAVLALGALVFSQEERKTEREIAKDRVDIEREIASERAQGIALQSYLDRMSDLMLEKDLRESKPGDEVRTVARARTLTVLPGLDAELKSSVLQFLYESGLIGFTRDSGENDKVYEAIISLGEANLNGVSMPEKAILSGVNLRRVNLEGASLYDTLLTYVDLSFANLQGADLYISWLISANLRGAKLIDADLHGADLQGANLQKSDLRGADLQGASLYGADLQGADLQGATVDNDHLSEARALKDVTMPNGSRYDGRFNLEGDLEKARSDDVDVDNPEAMAKFYGVSDDEYERGQEWWQKRLAMAMLAEDE